jgi:alpha 1,3-glucosidase
MNEPSVFNGPEGTLPKSSKHVLNDANVTQVLHRDVHNAYGLLMARATYLGALFREDKIEERTRPFVLTRSAFFGTQKYAAKWTGDNRSNREEVDASISMLLSLGISGIPFVGADIPGFYGNTTDEVFVMFYQLGGFYPFMRAHSHIESLHREPYLQTDLVKRTIKDTVFLRYELMHYIYTTFYVSSTEGLPVMRAMWLEFPGDVNALTLTD